MEAEARSAASEGAVRYLAIAIAVSLAAFTAVAMAGAPGFDSRTLLSVGFINVYAFDLVLGLSLLALLVVNAFYFRQDPVPLNRLVVWLCLVFLGYELFVVLPAAVLLHDLRAIDVFRLLEYRLDLLLVLVLYVVVLRFISPELLVTVFDVAAAGLAFWIIYRYVAIGSTGTWEDGVYRLRVAWGGSSLLFCWLILSSLFYWPVRPWRLVLAIVAAGAVVMTNHRSAFLALLAALMVQVLASGRITRRVALALAAVAVMGIGVYFASPTVRNSVSYSLRTMFNPSADVTSQDRVVRSLMSLAYFGQHPLGDNIWNQRYYLVQVTYNFPPHNFVVQRLVTQGMIGSALFFAVLGVVVVLGWRNRRDRCSAFCLTYLALYLVFCSLNANIDLRENQALFAVVVAMILARNRSLQEAVAKPPEVSDVAASLPEQAIYLEGHLK